MARHHALDSYNSQIHLKPEQMNPERLSSSGSPEEEQALRDEISALSIRLSAARERLTSISSAQHHYHELDLPRHCSMTPHLELTLPAITPPSSLHTLLLLSDSALPLGSFAFSSGLESYLAHQRFMSSAVSSSAATSPAPASATSPPVTSAHTPASAFSTFLPLSLHSHSTLTLPFVVAAYRKPASLLDLDDLLDATTLCPVTRRASITQGRALLAVYEKSLLPYLIVHRAFNSGSDSHPDPDPDPDQSQVHSPAIQALHAFSASLKRSVPPTSTSTSASASQLHHHHRDEAGTQTQTHTQTHTHAHAHAHLPPLFGAIARALGLSESHAAYVYLFSHARAVVSAAVRAGTLGPYQAQKILAGEEVRALLERCLQRDGKIEPGGGGGGGGGGDVMIVTAQRVPLMDLWIGRHEMLYSRVFNS